MYNLFLLVFVCSRLTCAQNGKLLNVALYSTQTLIDDYSGATSEMTGFSTQNARPFNMTLFRMHDQRQTIFTTVSLGGVGPTVITNFPNGTYTDAGEENSGDFLKVTIPTGADVSKKTGVFSFHVANDDGSANTAIVMQVLSASVTPVHRTITLSLGEKVTIHMLTDHPTSDLRWRLNYGDVITEWNGLSNVTIDVVRLKDDGVYECYHEESGTDGNHGIMRLIVRGCPSPRWNPPGCDKFCPVCYNGGVCDDVTGMCVCLSGFKGQQCETVCPSDTFGRDCALMCSPTSDGCKGALICPSDPAGCSCGNGYGGIDCTKPCDDGWYGAGCNQICNCDNASCDKRSGCTGNCLPSYTEESQCKELMQDVPCPEGFYGDLCNLQCHCEYSVTCERKSGSCAGGCERGWGRAGNTSCSIALAVLSHPPRVVSRTNDSITIDFTWSPTKDYGTGDVRVNLLWYNTSDNLTLHRIHVFSNQHTISDLPADSLVTFYVEHIQVLNKENFHGPESPIGTAVTTCSEPLDAPSVVHISRTPNEITVTLQMFSIGESLDSACTFGNPQGVDERIERILCDQIVRYDVRYKSVDGINETTIPVDYAFDQQVRIRGVAGCTGYQIDTRVVNNEGFTGPWSDVVATTETLPAPTISNWSYTSAGNSVRVSWQAVRCTSYDSNHRVRYYYEIPGTVLGDSTYETEVDFDSKELDPCTFYTFNIYASFAEVIGPNSSISFVTKPLAPTSSWSFTSAGDSLRVSWQAVRCTSYDSNHSVRYYYEIPGTVFGDSTYETEVDFDSKELDSCTFYTFNIYASFAEVIGPNSSISFVTKPVAPTMSWSFTLAGDSLRVSWQAVRCTSYDSNQRVKYYYEIPGTVFGDSTYETEVDFNSKELDPCTFYTFNIYASFAEVIGQNSSISFVTKPVAPTISWSFNSAGDSLRVSWQAVRCTSYDSNHRVRYYYEIPGTVLGDSTYETEVDFDSKELDPCTFYTFNIYASFAEVIGPNSSISFVTKPLAPTISNWSYRPTLAGDSVRVFWQAIQCSSYDTQIRVKYNYEVPGTVPWTATYETNVDLDSVFNPCTFYTFNIYASFAEVSGPNSSISFITKPLVPKNIRESAVGERSFTIKWDTINCSKGVDLLYNYQLNYGSGILNESWTTDTEVVFDRHITPCTEYSLTLFAFSNDVIGPSATFVVITDPVAPSFEFVSWNASSIYANWSMVQGCTISQYHVVLSDENGTVVATKNTEQTFVQFDEVSINLSYTVKIAATTGKGYGKYSELFPVPPRTMHTVNSTTTDQPKLVGGDIIAIVVGSVLVIILVISSIRIMRSRRRNKDANDRPTMLLDLQSGSDSKEDYSMSNSTTHDTFTETNSSSYK